MRKFLAFFLSLTLMFSLAACSVSDSDKDEDDQKPKKEPSSKATDPTEEETEPDVTEPALQDGYCWVYGSGEEVIAFAQELAWLENPETYYIYDFNEDGLGELILSENGQAPVVYQYENGTVYSSELEEDQEGVLSGLTALSGYEALSGIYSQQTKVQAPISEVFTQESENHFTNGRETVVALEDNTVLLIDTTVPSVKTYSQLRYNEDILGVTKNSVYFSYYDEDFGIGVEIYTLDRNGNFAQDHGLICVGYYMPGIVLIHGKRTDVSPTTIYVYNNDDEPIVDGVCGWSPREELGAFYYLELSRNPYSEFENEEPISAKLMRLDSDSLTAILELTVSPNHISSIYDGKLMIMDGGEQVFYDLTTGQVVDG